ncbi:MAG TPA: GNAT family N-acetyltransferase [Roseateles sp.]|nr:GNAT family N-acetyltransferase [Roseateles sp.]
MEKSKAEIQIRRTQISDAAAMARIMSHPEVLPGLLQMPFGNEEQWKQKLTDNLAPARSQDLHLAAVLDGEVVGNAGLAASGPSLRRRHAMHLGMAVVPEAQGRGVGGALMAALLDYADNWGQVLRIELGVFVDNERAIRLYQRFGFEIEGRQRAYALRHGQFADCYAMARLHPSPPSLGA